jgi:hypothetical protein
MQNTVPNARVVRDHMAKRSGGFDGDLLFDLLRLCGLGQSDREHALLEACFDLIVSTPSGTVKVRSNEPKFRSRM